MNVTNNTFSDLNQTLLTTQKQDKGNRQSCDSTKLKDMLGRILPDTKNEKTGSIDITTVTVDFINEALKADDDNIKAKANELAETIENYSSDKETFRDVLAAIGKFFAYICASIGLFSNVYDACCKLRNSALDDTIRKPLFEGAKEIIEQQLKDASHPLDDDKKLQYIHLLSSLDAEATKEYLNSPETNTLLQFSDKVYTYVDFFKKLDDEYRNAKLPEATSQPDGIQRSELIAGIRENLTLGAQIGKIGDEREILQFADSPLVRYRDLKLPKTQQPYIKHLAEQTKSILFNSGNNQEPSLNISDMAQWEITEQQKQNIFEQLTNLEPMLKDSFGKGKKIGDLTKSDNNLYHSEDGTLILGINQGNTLSLENAEKLGLVTPETVKQLVEQYSSINKSKADITIQPLFLSYRPTQTVTDGMTAAKNIFDGTPKALEHADKFMQELSEKIDTINDAIREITNILQLGTNARNSESKEQTQTNNTLNHFTNNNPLKVIVNLGHSLGGMIAHAMGAKYNQASICFNPLGTGKGVRNFIGEEQCKQANDANHANCHQSFVANEDWVSDDQHSKIAAFIKKPLIGQSYFMQKDTNEGNIISHHNEYKDDIKRNIAKVNEKESSGSTQNIPDYA